MNVLYATYGWVLFFNPVLSFSPVAPAVFLREGYAGNITPCRVLVVVQITSFFPLVRNLAFLLFDGSEWTLPQSQWGSLGLCAL
jgi:hypothetical protein